MAHPGGRPNEYTDELIVKAREYIQSCEDRYETVQVGETSKTIQKVKIPTIEGLALVLGISRETVYAWEKERTITGEQKYPEFSDILSELRAKQANALISKGLSGEYNSTIAKVLLTKHGYREGLDQTTNDKDLPTPIAVIERIGE